ncbi:MAG: divergent PAP2 family protein [Anaerotruncus sp.]|nr:divergent PAP2 family protein [Anaerotruncus sp.]
MNPIQLLTSNYVINVGFLAWLAAQVLKTLLAYIPNKKIIWERMVGSGGMPSSHSALVCAISVGIARTLGYDSPEFGLSLALAGIVMYDAMGVRRAAGEQAKVLNRMVIDFKDMFQMIKEEFDALAKGEQLGDVGERIDGRRKALKEFLGHTPLEVLCGAILGIVIAMVVPVK